MGHKSLYCCHVMSLKALKTKESGRGYQCAQHHISTALVQKKTLYCSQKAKGTYYANPLWCDRTAKPRVSPIYSQFKALKSLRTSISCNRKKNTYSNLNEDKVLYNQHDLILRLLILSEMQTKANLGLGFMIYFQSKLSLFSQSALSHTADCQFHQQATNCLSKQKRNKSLIRQLQQKTAGKTPNMQTVCILVVVNMYSSSEQEVATSELSLK